MVIPGFGDEADRLGLGPQQVLKPRIIRRRPARALHHAEGREAGAGRALLGKEGRVRRVGARIAALDVIEAEPIQHVDDGELVVQREIDARRLLAVTQGRVEEIEAFALHRFTSQLVVPSLLSMTTTPKASSSFLSRSLSAQLRALRALRRAAISSLTLSSSILAALSSTCLPVKPS